jgi:hypothetical protein
VITAQNWFVAGAASAGSSPDPRDWHIIYSNNEGYITRYDKNKEEGQDRAFGRWIMPGTARPIWFIVFNGSRHFSLTA